MSKLYKQEIQKTLDLIIGAPIEPIHEVCEKGKKVKNT
jgi:hypothetical protein